MMPNASETQTFTGRTDAAGKHYLEMTFAGMEAPRPYQVTAAARVMDVNRQTWASSTNLLVHPAAVYVGVRSASTFVQQGQPLEIDVIVTDVDGNPVAGRPVDVTATRVIWQFEKNEWVEKEIEPQSCTLASSDEAQRCTFATENGGEYRITADVRDADERLNRTIFTRWVAGGEQPPVRNVEQEEVLLIPDKESYAPGETAEILVQSPFTPAEGLLTVMRSGILYTERFTMDEATTTLRIPLEEAHIPNLHLQVDLVGAAPRTDEQGATIAGAPARPAYAKGTLELTIPPLSRTLDVALTPAETELAPGAQTTIDVAVTDAAGAPAAGAEVAVIVVDEAILALSNYTLTDPVALFYQPRSSDTQSAYGRDSIVLADASMLVEQLANEAAMGGAMPMAAMAAAPESMERDADSMMARHGHGRDGRVGGGRGRRRRADCHAQRLQPAGALCARGLHRRSRAGDSGSHAARQLDPLSHHGRGRGRREVLWLSRSEPDGTPAAHGAAVRAAFPQLRRPHRTARRDPEPDGRSIHG